MFNLFKSPRKSDTELRNLAERKIENKSTNLTNEFQTKLLSKIQELFTNEQQQLFVASFYGYLNYNSKNDFVINLDEVWKWCGFSRKDPAKRVVEKYFTENVDYKIIFLQSGENKIAEKAAPQVGGAAFSTCNLGGAGLNKETVLMTINTFKKFCLKAGTKKADEIHDYYIKLEELMHETLQEESEQLKKQLQEKEVELLKYKEKKYEEIEKNAHIYIVKTDGGYKVGKTKDVVTKRIKGLQTANVNDIELILDYRTSNADLLEKIVHYILERYRCNSNREFFDCDIDYITNIVNIVGITIDTLKSSYQSIKHDEILTKLGDKLQHDFPSPNKNRIKNDESNKNDFVKWLEKNLEYRENSLVKLKDICQVYLNKTNVHSSETSKYKIEIEKYIKDKYTNLRWEYTTNKVGERAVKCWRGLTLKDE